VSSTTRRRLLFTLQAIASIALLAILASRTDLGTVIGAIREVRYAALLGALAAIATQSRLWA